MPSWWRKSSKDVKKSRGESFIGSFRRTCIGPGAPRRQRSDSTSEKVSQSRVDSKSPSPSKQVICFQSFDERPQAQPLPLPGSNSTDIYHADSGGRKSKGPPVDRGSKPRILLPLPKPGHVKIIREHAEGGERYLATASSSCDSSSDTDDPYDSRLLSPQASDYENGVKSDAASPSGLTRRDKFPFANKRNSKEMPKSEDIVLNCRTSPTSPNQRPVDAKVAHLQVPHQGVFFSALDSSMSSPSRSPMRVICDEPSNGGFWLGKPYTDLSQVGSGHCSSPSSVHNSGHNSVAGDVSYQLFWPQSRCSPECSPLPSPRMTSPGPCSRIQSGTVTPLHPCSGGPSAESSTAWLEDGRQQSHRLPLPPKTRYNSPFTASYSAGNSPTIARSPGRPDNPTSPGLRWKKGRLLGRGTFGHVYLGFNSESGEMCAMKEVTLFSDDARSRESSQQLGQEIALLSCLHHPNIVQYYGSETVDDKLYIYLEFVSGGSIYKILQEYGQLGEAAIRSYTHQIVSGLAYLHGQNTIHRDIKGANILVDPNGRVKLADFGMAKHINGQSCPLSFKGSPYWMAPEVINNSSGYNLAVDIWSLGCTVLEMATTKPPWSQYEGVAAMFKIGNSKELPEIPNHLSEEGKDFVRQCLQRNPSNRPTAAKLLEHPFVKNSVFLERPVLLSNPKESIPALKNAVRALGFGHSRTPCLDSPGAVSRSKTPKTVPGLSDGYVSRNIPCPLPPVASPRSCSRSPQHVNGRLSPSPISSPRATSSASTPTGGNVGAIPRHHLQTTNNSHEGIGMNAFHSHGIGYQEHMPDIFRGIIQAHLSLESVSRENKVRGNKVEHPVLHDQNEQLYDAPRVLADRVSQQLLRNPVRIYQGPSSPLPSPRNLY